MNTAVSSSQADRELIIHRLFNAPRELVFKVWTQPEHVANWWGPTGFSNTVHEMKVEPGGVWRFDMHGPDGVTYPNKIVYEEVIAPERLVFAYGSDVENDPEQFKVTVTFESRGSQTALTMCMLFPSKEQKDKVVKEHGAIEGNTQTMDRLELHLAQLVYSTSEHTIVTTRIVHFTVSLIFAAWQNPELLSRWWGPKGFTNTFSTFEFKQGGVWEFVMHGPDGNSYPNKSVFSEIIPTSRIVFDHISSHPFRMVVTLEPVGENTRLTLTMIHATAEESEKVRPFVVPSNEENLDKLETLLRSTLSSATKRSAPFRIERVFNAPLARVWSAISSKQEMKGWYFDLAEFKPEVGFSFSFTGKGSDGQTEYVHLCEVTEVIPFQKLAYTWRYEKYEGDSLVTFELFAEGNQTKLVFTHDGLDSFPVHPDFARRSFEEGWTSIIGKSLSEYLQK